MAGGEAIRLRAELSNASPCCSTSHRGRGGWEVILLLPFYRARHRIVEWANSDVHKKCNRADEWQSLLSLICGLGSCMLLLFSVHRLSQRDSAKHNSCDWAAPQVSHQNWTQKRFFFLAKLMCICMHIGSTWTFSFQSHFFVNSSSWLTESSCQPVVASNYWFCLNVEDYN